MPHHLHSGESIAAYRVLQAFRLPNDRFTLTKRFDRVAEEAAAEYHAQHQLDWHQALLDRHANMTHALTTLVTVKVAVEHGLEHEDALHAACTDVLECAENLHDVLPAGLQSQMPEKSALADGLSEMLNLMNAPIRNHRALHEGRVARMRQKSAALKPAEDAGRADLSEAFFAKNGDAAKNRSRGR